MSPRRVPHETIPTDPGVKWLLGAHIEREAADLPIAALAWLPAAPRMLAGARPDEEVVRLADGQYGFVHRVQVIATGLGPGAIRVRLRRHWLAAYHRDVYLVGGRRPDRFGLAMAAVLHFRGHAIVAGESAASLWGLIDRAPDTPTVALVGRQGHSRPGIVVRRIGTLAPAEVRRKWSLPVMSPARALVDSAGGLDELDLENAIARCLDDRLATRAEILATLARTPRAAGAATIRDILDSATPALTRSAMERRLRQLLKRAQLPQPLSNTELLGYEVDFLWPAQRLVVEFDGWLTHRGRRSFERDRERDQRLVAAGYRVMRVTTRQLESDPFAVIARLATALAISPPGYWPPPVAARA